jgi:hypothetical protein
MLFYNLDIFLFLILKPNMELVSLLQRKVCELVAQHIINLTNLLFWKTGDY